MHHLPYLPQHTQRDLPEMQEVNKVVNKATKSVFGLYKNIWEVYLSSFYLQYLFHLFAYQLLLSSLEPPATPKKEID